MRFSKAILFGVIAGILAGAAHASGHIGVIGPVYPIEEEHALNAILRNLKEKERTGELARLQKEAVRRSLGGVQNQRPVEGLSVAKEHTRRLIDPTVHYDEAVTTDEGQIVVPAGAKINPLLLTKLTRTLVFFDGTDPAQREAVRKVVAKHGTRVRPILVAGPWMDMTREWQTQVFFDQQGSLSKRFGIRAVPTVIRQEGGSLVLEEIPAKDLR